MVVDEAGEGTTEPPPSKMGGVHVYALGSAWRWQAPTPPDGLVIWHHNKQLLALSAMSVPHVNLTVLQKQSIHALLPSDLELRDSFPSRLVLPRLPRTPESAGRN